jgi:hypothetical protein
MEANLKFNFFFKGSSNEQRRKLLKRIIDLTRRFLDKNGHSDRLVAYLYIVASFNSDIHSSYNLWPIDKDAPLRLRGGDALAVRQKQVFCVFLVRLVVFRGSKYETK